MDSSGVSPLRSSPAAVFCLSVSGSVFLRRLPLENVGGPFIQAFLGHEDASVRRIDTNGATRAKWDGPTRPGTIATWDLPFGPPASVR